MNNKIARLKSRKVKLEVFFKVVAEVFRKRNRIKSLHIIVLDEKNDGFINVSTTPGINIFFTKKEIHLLGKVDKRDIFYPKKMFWDDNLLRQILLVKINCKLLMHGISTVMPIYCHSKFTCIILFKDQLHDDWIKKNSRYLNIFRREIIYCLEAILLYNQTLEGIIRKRGHLDE